MSNRFAIDWRRKWIAAAALVAGAACAWAAGLQETEPGVSPSAEEIESLTASVLARAEFQGSPTAPGVWELVGDFLRSLLGPWAENLGSAALAWAILALVLLLAGYLVWTIWSETGLALPAVSGAGRTASTPWRALDGTASSWSEAMAKARRALEEGRVYETLWISHRAFLGLLEKRGMIEFVKWKTNSDYLAECPTEDGAYPLFESVSQAYEDAVYGHRQIAGDRLAELLRRIEEAGRDERL